MGKPWLQLEEIKALKDDMQARALVSHKHELEQEIDRLELMSTNKGWQSMRRFKAGSFGSVLL